METDAISESDNQNAQKLVSMNEKPGKKCLRHAIWLNALISAVPACRYSVFCLFAKYSPAPAYNIMYLE